MGRRRSSQDPVLERLKYEVAQELGIVSGRGEAEYRSNLDRMKYEVAEELGLDAKLRQVGWPNMTSRECGLIGGKLGGKIGGQMVKRMIDYAKAAMSRDVTLR